MISLAALGRFDRDLARHVHTENQQQTFLRELAEARTLATRGNPMARVGFAGIQGYVDKAQAELDTRADQFADRVDQVKGRGLGTLDQHHKRLDGVEAQIDHMDAMVREGSNGGPLPDAAPQSEPQGGIHSHTPPSMRSQTST